MIRKIIIWCEENKTKGKSTGMHYVNVEGLYEFLAEELKSKVFENEKKAALKMRHNDTHNPE